MRDGEWRADPRRGSRLVGELRSPALEAALAAAPAGTRLEYRYGGLCVAVRGAVTRSGGAGRVVPCRRGVRGRHGPRVRAAARPRPGDGAAGAGRRRARARWIAEGVQRVQWHTPPRACRRPAPRTSSPWRTRRRAAALGGKAPARQRPSSSAWCSRAIILGAGYAFGSLRAARSSSSSSRAVLPLAAVAAPPGGRRDEHRRPPRGRTPLVARGLRARVRVRTRHAGSRTATRSAAGSTRPCRARRSRCCAGDGCAARPVDGRRAT